MNSISESSKAVVSPLADDALDDLAHARHPDPFAILGMHRNPQGQGVTVRCWRPGVERASLIDEDGEEHPLQPRGTSGLFEGALESVLPRYRLRFRHGGHQWDEDDAYRFGSLLGPTDIHLLAEGSDRRYERKMGAHPMTVDEVSGTRFVVWAPNARRVSVVGDFNDWDGRRHPMRLHPGAGLWELFVPGARRGQAYKFEMLGPNGVSLKADPVAFQTEVPPATASVICGLPEHEWQDQDWMRRRGITSSESAPMSVYEVHLESWRRGWDGRSLSYEQLGDQLIPYVLDLGYTHIECLPLSEYPFGGSWGYQPTSLFAPTSRFGDAAAFARFVDRCHQAGLGVIVDFVPAHFPRDAHGLARFDGTALYEHEDPRLGFHHDWNTLIYNFGRREVRNFLCAAARHWCEQFHIDGLRVDAVASMLYLDYSRAADAWIPNRYGGNHNLEAIEFLRAMNEEVHQSCPGVLTIAEESTAFDGVTRSIADNGLGFDFKWNMGWMHDTLKYIAHEPVHRKWHHDQMTFGLVYAFSERYVLAISHDEVVHGKGSLIGKMPGDAWQKFANLRAYLGFMWTHPGKKLLFMGCEFGQFAEWNHDAQIDWNSLGDERHAGVQRLVRDLNRLYSREPALHERDAHQDGFEWIDTLDRDGSVLVYMRKASPDSTARPVVVACNFTPAPRHDYRIGVPCGGRWQELLNTDAGIYGGSNVGNYGGVDATDHGWQGRPNSLSLSLPPLGVVVLGADIG